MPDTSLIASDIISRVLSDDKKSTIIKRSFYSYDNENRVVTSSLIKGIDRSYQECVLSTYSNTGRFLDQSTMILDNGIWSTGVRNIERKYDDVDTVIYFDYISNYASRSIYKKNSIGQIIELVVFEKQSNDQWYKVYRGTYEYDARGNQIFLMNENWMSSGSYGGSLRILTEYNENNQPVTIRREILIDGVWTGGNLYTYTYDYKKRLVSVVLAGTEKTTYVYTQHGAKSIVKQIIYDNYGDGWYMRSEAIDTTDYFGFVIGTSLRYFENDSCISAGKIKYEYDSYGNLTSRISLKLDEDGEWKDDIREDKTYIHIFSRKKECNDRFIKKGDCLSEIESFYANPFNFERQVRFFDSKGIKPDKRIET
jgi:hypothetical protein